VLHGSMQRRSEVSLLRCKLPAAGRCPRLARPILLAKPLRHLLLDFFLVEKLATLSRLATATNRLLNVDMVVNVFERGFIRKRLEQSLNLFLRPTHTLFMLPRVSSPNDKTVQAACHTFPDFPEACTRGSVGGEDDELANRVAVGGRRCQLSYVIVFTL